MRRGTCTHCKTPVTETIQLGWTLDHAHLDPYAPDLADQVARTARLLAERELAVVVETGARYLLDPRRKHAPTFLHDDAHRRVDFLKRAIDVAEGLGAEAVSFWAGVRPAHVSADVAWQLLGMIDGLNAHALVRWEDATDRGSRIGHAVEGMLGLGRGALAPSGG